MSLRMFLHGAMSDTNPAIIEGNLPNPKRQLANTGFGRAGNVVPGNCVRIRYRVTTRVFIEDFAWAVIRYSGI